LRSWDGYLVTIISRISVRGNWENHLTGDGIVTIILQKKVIEEPDPMFDAILQKQLGELRLEELRREAVCTQRLAELRAVRRPAGAIRRALGARVVRAGQRLMGEAAD
jgi:hypothetical protein